MSTRFYSLILCTEKEILLSHIFLSSFYVHGVVPTLSDMIFFGIRRERKEGISISLDK
jgi:hypothetical protein